MCVKQSNGYRIQQSLGCFTATSSAFYHSPRREDVGTVHGIVEVVLQIRRRLQAHLTLTSTGCMHGVPKSL